MKKTLLGTFIGISVALVVLGTARHVTAQAQKADSLARARVVASKFRIRSFQGTGTQSAIKSPVYQTNQRAGRSRPNDWGQVVLEYDTDLPWIDDLTIEFFVLTLGNNNGKVAYSFYTKSVRYGDIEQGRQHMAVVYLRPSAIKRFGPIVATGVEVSFEGQVIAKQSDVSKAARLTTGEWWRNKQVIEHPSVTRRSGYLLNKKESPFALINIDDYEVIR